MIANLMVPPEQLRDVKAAFNQWDTNKDGTLTEDEIEEHMAEICSHFNLEPINARKLLKAADINKDGRIDFSEFVAAALDRKQLLSDKNLRAAFNALDTNGSGYLEKDNIEGILSYSNTDNVMQNTS